MKILVACEESQAVTIEMRKRGHLAYSCDIEPCSGDSEWHVQQDVKAILKAGDYMFCQEETQDGHLFDMAKNWDMIIAFHPCTHLAVSGSKYFAQKIADGRQQQGIDFFMMFANHDCPRIAIENPVGIKSTGKYGGFVNRDENGKIIAWNDPRAAIIRSKTYPGIAEAMAQQWG